MTDPEPVRTDESAADAAMLLALPRAGPQVMAGLLADHGGPTGALDAVRTGRTSPVTEPARLATWQTWLAGPEAARAAAAARRRRAHATWAAEASWPVRDSPPGGPFLLLTEGRHREVLGTPIAAIVGTRRATPQGLADAHSLAAHVSARGITVLSGLAIGIDAAAHEGALSIHGPTAAVVATGLDVIYPRRHYALTERIRREGVLVTETAYGVQPQRWRFPPRNRIIAALADIVIVIEATIDGGARITADHALDYGRPVLAMPGSRRNAAAAGCNQLIADGAHPLLDPDDVLVALGSDAPQPTKSPWSTADHAGADPIMTALGGDAATLDELGRRTGLAPADVARRVRLLRRAGSVTLLGGTVWPM